MRGRADGVPFGTAGSEARFAAPGRTLKYVAPRFAPVETTAGGGSVEAFAAGVPEPARGLLQTLRSALLRLGGVTEKMIVDYDAREDSPAFYVGSRQLCHVHVAADHIAVTISLGRALTLDVVKARDIPEGIRAVVETTKEYGATRWVNLKLTRREEVDGFLALARLKHGYLLTGGPSDLAVPKDQTTLEKFE